MYAAASAPSSTALYRCSDNKWCCSHGGNITSCCNDPGVSTFSSSLSTIYNGSAWSPNYTIAAVSDVRRDSSPSSSAAPSNCPTSANLAGGGNDTAGQQCPANDVGKATMEVGLGVGLGMGIPLLAALGALGVLWGRERSANR